SAVLVGVVGGDSVTLNTGSAVGTFDTPDVGTGKTVTVSGLALSGADSGNYTLTQPTTTASIFAAGLTITGVTANDKTYDGTTTATLNTGGATLVGVELGDDVTLDTSSATGSFDNKNVGVGKTVTTSGFSISGADAGKYSLNQPTATASITAKNLTVTGVTADDKTYDGTTVATLNFGGATLVGVIVPDSVTLDTSSAVGTFDTPDVGTGKTVTVSGLALSGTDSGNYTLTQPTTTASIISAPIVATKFVIVQPADAQVNNSITVTVRAEDNSGNLDTTYSNLVTLFSTGSATGGGALTVTNGIGTIALNNTVAETVTLFLIDSAGTGLDVSSTKDVSWTSAPVAPSVPLTPTRPIPTIIARAFPNATISISSFTAGGSFESTRTVSSSAGFFEIFLKSEGNTTYGVFATDADGNTTPAKVFSFDLDIGGLETDIDVTVAPTIKLLRSSITRGDNLIVSGYSFPNSSVRAFVDGVQIGGTARTDDSGKYRILINTVGLDFGPHNVWVDEILSDGRTSGNSLTRSFTISSVFTPQADFNGDGQVDIQDWSVFLSKWNTLPRPSSDLDLNGDGLVDIADFSIMLRAVQR
ncbi:MAG: YDG domain-containing protein, partial [Candidatus Colwellbacteria bacterium]|nr:YDG domain-containing protein [Candidatus Colwellbacteria bacterium]